LSKDFSHDGISFLLSAEKRGFSKDVFDVLLLSVDAVLDVGSVLPSKRLKNRRVDSSMN
jgi:hypothetical protein